MIEWRPSTWGDEITLGYGKAIRGYQDAVGAYRVYGTNGPVGWTNDYLAPGPGIILGRKGAYRGVHFSNDPFWVIDTAYYVQPRHDQLDMRWLFYAIQYHKLGEIDDGSPIPSTTRAAVYVRDLDVPSLSEQKAIAKCLMVYDDKIDLNRQINETLESLIRAIFKDWFVDFGPTHRQAAGETDPIIILGGLLPNLKQATPLAALFPSHFGKNGLPKEWEEKEIGNILTRLKVGKLYNQKSAHISGLVPILDQGKQGIIGYHNDAPNILASRQCRVAVFANHTCVQRLLDFDFSTIQNVIPFQGKILPTEWCHYATLGKQTFEEYKGHWPTFIGRSVVVPSQSIAEKFAEFIDPILELISQNTRENKTLATTRDLLLYELMSGNLRLKSAGVDA